MALVPHIKNPEYNPNDPNSKRYIPQDSSGGVTVMDRPPGGSGSVQIVDLQGNPVQGTKNTPSASQNGNSGQIPGGSGQIINTQGNNQPQKQFYRVGKDIYDASTNQRITSPDWEANWTGRASEVAAPAKPTLVYNGQNISPQDPNYETYKAQGATPVGQAGMGNTGDSYANMMSLIGQSGIGLEDAMSVLNAQNGVGTQDRQGIYNELGIPDLVGELFTRPSKTSEEIYQQAYRQSELPELKNKIREIDTQLNDLDAEFAREVGDLQGNPWLSKATRAGRLAQLRQQYEARSGILNNQRSQYINLYDQGASEIEGILTRYADQLETDKVFTSEKLNFLLGEAERRMDELQSERYGENLRYLPDYLKGASSYTDPEKSLDLMLKEIQLQKAMNELNGITDPIEREKKELELAKLRAEVKKIEGGSTDVTPAQALASGYATRIENSNKILSELERIGTGKGLGNSVIGQFLPEMLKSDDRKRFEQAERNLINAILRRESGAAIAESEFESARKQYIPQVGDGADVLKQKAQNRKDVFDALKLEAGNAYINSTEKLQSDYDSVDFDIPFQEALEIYGPEALSQIIESQKKNSNTVGQGMRTDRHNNPTALMWTPNVESFFKNLGYNVGKGDKFPESNNYTLNMSGVSDPVKATIDYIDRYGFYYNGQQRWSHTAMSKSEWDRLPESQKRSVVYRMYQNEGNQGVLNNYFV